MTINIDHITNTIDSTTNLTFGKGINLSANSSSNIARWVMDTSNATASYWTKIATLNLGSLDNADIALVLSLVSTSGTGLGTAQIDLIAKQTTAIDATESKVKFGNVSNVTAVGYNNVMMVATSTTKGTDIDVWFKSDIAAVWRITEIVNKINSDAITPVTYYNGSTWTVTTPSGTFSVISSAGDSIAYAGAVGEVAFFAGSTAPTGWIKANGAAISRTAYSNLFTAIGTVFGTGDGSTTFNLPDLRGEFPRGFDDGRGVDSGRTFGSWQADDLIAHTHNVDRGNTSNNAGNVLARSYVGTSPDTQATSSVGGSETRPRNIALLACIKY